MCSIAMCIISLCTKKIVHNKAVHNNFTSKCCPPIIFMTIDARFVISWNFDLIDS